MPSFKRVILGGGMVAGYAAKGFAEGANRAGEVAIVSADSALPYERPPLSKGFLAGKDTAESILINPEAFYRDHHIEVLLNTWVESVDAKARRLNLRGGTTIGYEQLLIATGARVRTLSVPGAKAAGILYLRSLDDSARIRDAAGKSKQAVVLGSGFIAMEVAAVLAQKGIPVTMVSRDERIWQRFFSREMSEFFQGYYKDRGVAFVFGDEVAEFKGGGRVSGVALQSGKQVPADLVVAGIGVMPETDALAGSGLAIDNGVTVNEYLETNVPGVYAAGDVANYMDVLWQKRRRVEHWDNAVEQGQHAARVMLGKRAPFEHVPYFFSDVFDLSYELWGDTESADRVVYRGQIGSASFSAWWIRDNRVTAAFVMRRPDEEREAAPALIKSGVRVLPEALANPQQALSALAS